MQDLLSELSKRGVELSLRNGELFLGYQRGALNSQLRERVSVNKPALIAYLRQQEVAAHQAQVAKEDWVGFEQTASISIEPYVSPGSFVAAGMNRTQYRLVAWAVGGPVGRYVCGLSSGFWLPYSVNYHAEGAASYAHDELNEIIEQLLSDRWEPAGKGAFWFDYHFTRHQYAHIAEEEAELWREIKDGKPKESGISWKSILTWGCSLWLAAALGYLIIVLVQGLL